MKRNVLRQVEKAGCRTSSKSQTAWEPKKNMLLWLYTPEEKVEVKVKNCIGECDYFC